MNIIHYIFNIQIIHNIIHKMSILVNIQAAQRAYSKSSVAPIQTLQKLSLDQINGSSINWNVPIIEEPLSPHEQLLRNIQTAQRAYSQENVSAIQILRELSLNQINNLAISWGVPIVEEPLSPHEKLLRNIQTAQRTYSQEKVSHIQTLRKLSLDQINDLIINK